MSRPRISHLRLAGSLLAAFAILTSPALSAPAERTATEIPAPPRARAEVVVDSAFGMRLSDPYRWMEKADNPEFLAWMRSQGEFARRQLENLPGRAEFGKRVGQLSGETESSYGAQRWGSSLFFQRLDKGASLPKLVVRSADGAERVLVDPATLAAPGTPHVSMDNLAVSFDGGFVACNLSEGGGEITRVRVLETATGAYRADEIEHIWGEFKVAWLPDASGFLYTQMAEEAFRDPQADKLLGMRVRLHKLGTPPSDDPVILGPGSSGPMKVAPEEFPSVEIPPGSAYVIAYGSGAHDEVRVYVARLGDLRPEGTPWRRVAEYEDDVEAVAVADSNLFLLSSKDAPNRRVLRVPLSNPDLSHAEEVVPQGERVIVSMASARDGLYTVELDGGVHRIFRTPYGRGSAEEVPLPLAGAVGDLFTDMRQDGVIFPLVSWTQPSAYYEWQPRSHHLAALDVRVKSPADFSGIVAERVEVRSFDGAMVPLTILHRKDLKLDKANPTILTGYGGYGTSQDPGFGAVRLAWLERGGVLAVAHTRGGGEKGRAWYLAGKGPNKPNGIRDFIACAEYLETKGYTAPSKLAARSASMGGILIGRAIVERPDLFGAAVIQAGMLNPVRYLQGTNGANQTSELGSPDTEEGLRALLAMDPTMAIDDKKHYPAVLLSVGLNDNRVAPWHSGKFAARLLATGGASPVLIRVDPESGHGVGSTRDQAVDLASDSYAFLWWQLGAGKPR